METSSDTNEDITSKAPLSPAARSRRRILWYLMATGFMLASYVFFRVPTYNEDDGKRTFTAAMATAITSSVRSFETENGNLPVPDGVTTTADTLFVMDQEKGTQVLNILTGKDLTKNPRAIPYLQVRAATNGKRGMTWTADGSKVTGLYDPWGNPYHLVLDTDYNEVVVVTIGGKAETIRDRRCVVFSAGKDRKLGTRDDFRSW